MSCLYLEVACYCEIYFAKSKEMKTFKLCIISLTLLVKNIAAQEVVQVTDETITVNSTTSVSGYTRNTTKVTLPEKTIGYIYRLSVFSKGNASVGSSLLSLLQKMGGANISLASSFAQFAINNNDNNSVDAYIFTNTYDADNFYAKKDGNWNACKSMPNRASCCFATSDCMGKELFFGFRNNNIMKGLDVKLEIVAIVDASLKTDYKYSYTINNSTDKELKYSLSLDNVNWQQTSLRSGYQQIYSFEQKEIYFKIYTDNFKFVMYKLTPNERYKIIWNTIAGKWDIVHF